MRASVRVLLSLSVVIDRGGKEAEEEEEVNEEKEARENEGRSSTPAQHCRTKRLRGAASNRPQATAPARERKRERQRERERAKSVEYGYGDHGTQRKTFNCSLKFGTLVLLLAKSSPRVRRRCRPLVGEGSAGGMAPSLMHDVGSTVPTQK